MPNQSGPRESLGQTQYIGVDTNHDATLISLHPHCGVHQLPDGVTQRLSRTNSTLAAGFDKVFFELERVSQCPCDDENNAPLPGIHHRRQAPAQMGCGPVAHQSCPSPPEAPNGSYLAACLSFVFFTTLFHFLIITFEGAVVLQETLKLVQYILQGLVVFLIFPCKGPQVIVQGIYISVPQHLDRVGGKAYACPKQLIKITRV